MEDRSALNAENVHPSTPPQLHPSVLIPIWHDSTRAKNPSVQTIRYAPRSDTHQTLGLMTIQSFTFNGFMTNMYVAHRNGEAAIIDASCATEEEHRQVESYIDEHDLTVTHLVLTHAHIDHIFGCARLEATYEQAFYLHPSGTPFYEQAAQQAQAFGVTIDPPQRSTQPLTPEDTLTIAGVRFRILHTPGHSPDSISLVADDEDFAFTGDVLFQDSIGRTQGLPQTSLPDLMASIREKLLPLGDDMTIYPGHGAVTTIGRERKQNPFLNDEVPGLAG